MIERTVTAEVHFIDHDSHNYPYIPTYRLFLDNELFAERSWIYHSSTFLLEHICFESDKDEHCLSIEAVDLVALPDDKHYAFELRNLTINDEVLDACGTDLQFTINN